MSEVASGSGTSCPGRASAASAAQKSPSAVTHDKQYGILTAFLFATVLLHLAKLSYTGYWVAASGCWLLAFSRYWPIAAGLLTAGYMLLLIVLLLLTTHCFY